METSQQPADAVLGPLLASAPPATRPPVPRWAAVAVGAAFGALSLLRGRRSLHPRGLAFAAVLRVPDDPRLPRAWRDLDAQPAVLRCSRAAGLPEPWPDVLGVALRVGEQDLLLSSTWSGPLLRRVLRPARDYLAPTFSSILAYEFAGRRGVLTGRFRSVPRARASTRRRLAEVAPGRSRLELRAHVARGRALPLGVVELGAPLDADASDRLRFHPWRTGGGLVPVGFLHRLRDPAYSASRAGAPR